MNSIRDLLQIAAFAMFCIPLNSCSKDEELVYDNTNLKNNYQIAFKEVESIHEDELQVITGEYSKSLAGDFGLITKDGLTEECDKEVVLACKDAECRLNDVSFKGNYTIEAVRLAKGKEKLIYSKTFSSTNATKLLEQQLVWEQGRFTTAGAKASNNNVIRTAVPIIVSQGEKYSFEAAGNTTTLGFYYDSNGKLVSPCFTIGGAQLPYQMVSFTCIFLIVV